jgi:hypothetical protein
MSAIPARVDPSQLGPNVRHQLFNDEEVALAIAESTNRFCQFRNPKIQILKSLNPQILKSH